ncbi:MAG: recombinase family protein [Bdellovibrionales bacterium]|nr:recombinase family protein [Bdellovibrionales bacterium]
MDQRLDVQTEALVSQAKIRGLSVIAVLTEKASGGNTDRAEYQRMMAMVERGECKCIAVYKIDRISRSLGDFVGMLKFLNEHGVRFVSFSDNIDSGDQSPQSKLLMNVMMSFADFERSLILSRTSEGRIAALKRGVKFGRPVQFNRNLIYDLRDQGLSLQAIAKRIGASKGAVSKVLKQRAVNKSDENLEITNTGDSSNVSE